jgi:hypothetical protein
LRRAWSLLVDKYTTFQTALGCGTSVCERRGGFCPMLRRSILRLAAAPTHKITVTGSPGCAPPTVITFVWQPPQSR